MYNFFVDATARVGDRYYIVGSDYNHIKNVLRMRVGEEFLVSDGGKSHLCTLEEYQDESAVAVIATEDYQSAELSVRIKLFQGLPKGDKLELIIQKAVELGAYEIVPVEMSRSVVKLDDRKKKSKQERWQAIAESAAKQSKRNVIPAVREAVSYAQALEMAKETDVFMVPYENEDGMKATAAALERIKKGCSVGILIGPEGGFDDREIEMAKAAGGEAVSLGKRILRAETASIAAVAMCMLYAEMNTESGAE
ncbi:MAG: 16S rRNA (uracil(1498)-N(3))-methyltransferase [Clostridia bacterium]|nr:16S rRNA (uracil(1498)-N(3))-methyltransferase [Clostridia bacterium]